MLTSMLKTTPSTIAMFQSANQITIALFPWELKRFMPKKLQACGHNFGHNTKAMFGLTNG